MASSWRVPFLKSSTILSLVLFLLSGGHFGFGLGCFLFFCTLYFIIFMNFFPMTREQVYIYHVNAKEKYMIFSS